MANKIPVNFMFDLETLSLESNALIVSIGCLKFNWDFSIEFTGNQISNKILEDSFYCRVDWETEQMSNPRIYDINISTLKWWLSISDHRARKELFDKKDSGSFLSTTLKKLFTFIYNYTPGNKYPVIWCTNNFDTNILQTVSKILAKDDASLITMPWKYNHIRDYRTACDNEFYPVNIDKKEQADRYFTIYPELIRHHALHDCIVQAAVLCDVKNSF